MLNFRHQYDDERDAAERDVTDYVQKEPALTEQHHGHDLDINEIVKRFGITDGAIPAAALDPRFYGDFSDAVDYRTALDRVQHARQRFDELPADLRAEFNNDPAELLAFVHDERNADRAVEMGLLARLPDPANTAVPTPTPTPPASEK